MLRRSAVTSGVSRVQSALTRATFRLSMARLKSSRLRTAASFALQVRHQSAVTSMNTVRFIFAKSLIRAGL